MKILVTGGAGFVGSHLIDTLINHDQEIVCLDNFSTGKKVNIETKKEDITIIEGDIRNKDILESALVGVECVFHLAAHFANQNSVDHPETDLLVNGLGTLKILEYSHLAKIGRVVFASSGCSVYGSEAPLPLKEDFVSLHLDTPYQITKLLGELYSYFYYNSIW